MPLNPTHDDRLRHARCKFSWRPVHAGVGFAIKSLAVSRHACRDTASPSFSVAFFGTPRVK